MFEVEEFISKKKSINFFKNILGILIKKLKRLNRSNVCSNSNNNLSNK